MYAGCPVYWQSKLQTEIALSTTEAEVLSLSQALRATIPLMEIAREMKRSGHFMQATTPTVHCRLFEDNSAAIELATKDKVRPRTKYMGTKWHHFRHYVENGEIKILPISTDDQPADMLSKPLPCDPFEKHRDFIMGWPRSPDERECEDSVGTAKQSVTVNLANTGTTGTGQDSLDSVFPVFTSTDSTESSLGQPGQLFAKDDSPTGIMSLTTDSKSSGPQLICSPNLHFSSPKSILRPSKYI